MAWGTSANTPTLRRLEALPSLRGAATVAQLIGAVIIFAVLGLLLASVGPVLFGYHTVVITSASMAPAVPVGSVLVSRPTPVESLKAGDIITFHRSERPATSVTHRVVGISDEGTERFFVTKGDANSVADPEPLELKGEIDRALYVVPFAGYILGFATSRSGAAILSAVAVLVLLPSPTSLLKRPSFAWTGALWRGKLRRRGRLVATTEERALQAGGDHRWGPVAEASRQAAPESRRPLCAWGPKLPGSGESPYPLAVWRALGPSDINGLETA